MTESDFIDFFESGATPPADPSRPGENGGAEEVAEPEEAKQLEEATEPEEASVNERSSPSSGPCTSSGSSTSSARKLTGDDLRAFDAKPEVARAVAEYVGLAAEEGIRQRWCVGDFALTVSLWR